VPSLYSPSLGRRKPRPWHRCNGSWGTVCGRQDFGFTGLLITERDTDVTCKSCLARMRALVRKHGPGVVR
jgi:hypothetical protein